jgi:polyhydroxybutyrate depolymerase
MKTFVASILALFAAITLHAQELKRMEVTVDGVVRFALVHTPAQTTEPAPLVLAWHGHGGGALQASRSFRIHKEWPQAVVVYPEGVPTAGKTDPAGVKRGWQKTPDDFSGRDLKFFDALFAQVKKDAIIDPKRVYSTGHSNGAAFTYLLWGARPDTFAAIAPSAGAFRPAFAGKPIPVIQFAGEKDEIVPFRIQQLCLQTTKRINGCATEGKPWGETKGATLYPSEKGAPLVSYIHSGGHAYPTEAPALIVRFFKEHSLK